MTVYCDMDNGECGGGLRMRVVTICQQIDGQIDLSTSCVVQRLKAHLFCRSAE